MMNEIINKAIEGGWKPVQVGGFQFPCRESCVLDHTFWQALSKSCGWIERNYGYILSNTTNQSTHDAGAPQWKFVALRFNEINLTQSWDKAIEYLYNLLPSNQKEQ